MQTKQLVKDAVGCGFRYFNASLLKKTLTIFSFHDVTDHPSLFSREHLLNISPDVFEFQLNFIKTNFRVISIDDLLQGDIPEKAAMITFDDGFRSYFTSAVPILERHHLPSLLFANMGPITDELFHSGLTTYLCQTEHFIDYFKSHKDYPQNEQAAFLACSRTVVEEYLGLNTERHADLPDKIRDYVGEFAQEKDLENTARNHLVFYGNHLFNHDNVKLLSDDELLLSLNKNKDILKKYPNYRDVFAFPFGQPESCFQRSHIYFLLDQGVKKVFSNAGAVNRDPLSPYLHRIPLYAFDNSNNLMWFRVFKSYLHQDKESDSK